MTTQTRSWAALPMEACPCQQWCHRSRVLLVSGPTAPSAVQWGVHQPWRLRLLGGQGLGGHRRQQQEEGTRDALRMHTLWCI